MLNGLLLWNMSYKIKTKNKYKHIKSKSDIEIDKCKHIILSLKDINIKNVDEAFFYTLLGTKKIRFLSCEMWI